MNLTSTPALAVDCVILNPDNEVLLIRRKNPPFQGSHALPGGFVEIGETAEAACRREVLEETGIAVKNLKLVGIYSDPERDPRGHICSAAFMARSPFIHPLASSDVEAAEWTQNWKALALAFDHAQILTDAFASAASLED